MARIQITDLNPSDFGFLEELTDEELLEIKGGKWYNWVIGALFVAAGVCTLNLGFVGAGVCVVLEDSSW
jgi:hypothetical protein